MHDVELARLRTAHPDRADLRHRRAIEDRYLHRARIDDVQELLLAIGRERETGRAQGTTVPCCARRACRTNLPAGREALNAVVRTIGHVDDAVA
jgi:hypothetical protein